MENHPPIRSNSKKRWVEEGSSSSSYIDPDIIEISPSPPPTWKIMSSKKKSIIGREIVVVDDEDADGVVINDEKAKCNGKGKKPMLNYSAGHEVITLDDVPSPRADSVKGRNLSLVDDNFESNNSPGTKSSKKHAAPASSSSRTSSNLHKPVKFIKSLADKSSVFKPACFGSKLSSLRHPSTSSHAQTNGLSQPLPQGPENFVHNQNMPPTSSHSYTPFAILKYLITATSSPSASHAINSLSIDDGIIAKISPPSTDGLGNASQNSILKKLELFKKFDTSEDHSGHIYEEKKDSDKPYKSWVNRIADEWRMLEKDLPDTIFVRVYEARMDLLRAVILGADGTPYHDGLFFFDVHFTASYPNSPPLVNYHAHGLRINPNLYNNGKVCLSLLGTWSGKGVEKWLPCKSNLLQVLVSIQGLVLNAEPYYNEPGFVKPKGTTQHNPSKAYSENAFILSLKTMIYTMRNPPKCFEDLVYGHFYNRAHDILAACRAYLEGVEVGSYVKGKSETVQDNSKACSQFLKKNLPTYIKALVEAFTKIGVKDCEKYLVPDN